MALCQTSEVSVSIETTYLYEMLAMLQLVWILIFVAVNGAEIPQNDGDVDIAKHPYIASIRKNGRHVCSGAIIDSRHIVTSDRCVPSFKHVWNIMNDIVVVTGTSSYKIVRHRSFSKEMFSQNRNANPTNHPTTSSLGVIRVMTPFQFGENVQPIELSTTEVPTGAELQMVGWMIIDHEGEKTTNLRKVTLEIVNHEECQPFHRKPLADFEFCTQPKTKNSFCKGNSGSPLIYEGKLVGLATYGISCDNVPVPDVHTSINQMHEYINETTNG